MTETPQVLFFCVIRMTNRCKVHVLVADCTVMVSFLVLPVCEKSC